MEIQQGGRAPGGVPSLRATTAFILFTAGLFLLGGLPLQLLFGEVGLLLSQVGLLLLPALGFAVLGGYDLRRVFPMRIPPLRIWVGGVVVLGGGVATAWFLAWAQSLVLPVPVEYLEAMAEALRPDSVGRWLWLLLLVAVVPALSEEVLFRGVVLSGLRGAVPTFWAILGVGLVFGLFHLSPQTAFRFLPTAWMGILLAWVVVVTRSLPLAIFLHFLNNGAILTLGALPMTRDQVAGAEATPPLFLLPMAMGLLLLGGALLRPRAPELPLEDGFPSRPPSPPHP